MVRSQLKLAVGQVSITNSVMFGNQRTVGPEKEM